MVIVIRPYLFPRSQQLRSEESAVFMCLTIFDFRWFSARRVKDFRISSEVWTILDFLRFPEKCEGFSEMLNIIVTSYHLIIVP